jgi:uncharacterized membrane protein
MSDPNQGGGRQPAPVVDTGNLLSNIPQLVYLLNLGGFVIAVLPLIGLVLAYVNRDRATPLERSHYDFQISTFWRGIVILLAGVVTVFFLVGWLVILFWVIWTIIRNVKGLTALGRKEPMPAGIGWGFG